jgi:hypothetical protein
MYEMYGILNKEVKIFKIILQKFNIPKHTHDEIIKYTDIKVKALHDDHYLCSDCISFMYYVANIHDTMFTSCPICCRNIIIGPRRTTY